MVKNKSLFIPLEVSMESAKSVIVSKVFCLFLGVFFRALDLIRIENAKSLGNLSKKEKSGALFTTGLKYLYLTLKSTYLLENETKTLSRQ